MQKPTSPPSSPNKKNFYMKLFIGDYLADTSHLSTVEHGAYLLLMMHYFRTRTPLNNNDHELSRITRMSLKGWRQLKLTLSQFFDVDENFWIHHRIEKELSENALKSEKARQSAFAATEAKKKKAANAKRTDENNEANAVRTDSERYANAQRMDMQVNSHSYSKEIIDMYLTTNNNSGKEDPPEKIVAEKIENQNFEEEGEPRQVDDGKKNFEKVVIDGKFEKVEIINPKPRGIRKPIRTDEYFPVLKIYFPNYAYVLDGGKLNEMCREWTQADVEPEDIHSAMDHAEIKKNHIETPLWYRHVVPKYALYRQDPERYTKPEKKETVVEKINKIFDQWEAPS